MSTTSEQDHERRELVQAVVDKLAPHLDIRCVPCGGSGVSIASGHDCRSCGGTGLAYAEMGEERAAALAREVIAEVWARFALNRLKALPEDLDAATRAIAMLRDETDPVIAAAERLVQDALGDDRLWPAVQPLREVLEGCPSRLNTRGELAREPSLSEES